MKKIEICREKSKTIFEKTAMDFVNLVKTQLELEGVGLDARGDLVAVPCPNPDPDGVPRLYSARSSQGVLRYLRQDVQGKLRDALQVFSDHMVFHCPQALVDALGEDKACQRHFLGSSYLFPEDFTGGDESGVSMVDATQSHFAIFKDRKIASQCRSARENARCAEAWVHTEEAFRQTGLAGKVLSAWGRHILKKNKIPFYSHAASNAASEHLVRSLGLAKIYEVAVYY